ncbi:MAG: type II toxin-antitoxin system RelE/ParE family toxin [Leptospirales bacterium]
MVNIPLTEYHYVDHIKQSRYPNMKELRVQNRKHVYRIFFAFDPKQTGVLLIAGDKRGKNKFYEKMIPIADKLYEKHLNSLRE